MNGASAAQEFRFAPQRLMTQIPARPRARDTRATESVLEFPMILIIPNLGPCTYLPSSRTLYENPDHAEPVSRRSVHRNPVA